ncbi:MAG: bile acid:sodium symporter family protein [Cryomorphaceae bacterium]
MMETLLEIDSIVLDFSNDGKNLLNLTIAFIMFGVALELKLDDFKKLMKQPKPALVGILSQFVMMPLLTFLLVFSLQSFITPTIGLGMILVAACPGGNISNFMSALAKGNVALSVSLTAFSSFAGIVLTPFNFAFWGNLYMKVCVSDASTELVRSLNIDALEVLQTIAIILGIPLLLGVAFSHKFPLLTERILVAIKRLSIFAFIAIIVLIFTKNFDTFLTYIKFIFFIVLVHNALALLMGYNLARLFKLDHKTRKTVAIETGIQNSGLALALLFNPAIFPVELAVGGMTFIAAWWGVWHIISGLTVAGFWSGFSLKSE